MRIVCFSDLHAHKFKSYAELTEGGLNSRLVFILDAIKQVRDYALDVQADLILFGGDLFHERRHIETDVFNLVWDELAKFKLFGVPILLIHGNHDQADRMGKYHSLYSMGSFLNVINEPGWVELPSLDGSEVVDVLAVPYIEEIEQLKEAINLPSPSTALKSTRIFLGHLGVQGSELGANFIYKNPIDCTVEDLQCHKFDRGFLGHFHKHQEVSDNFIYIGATIQHNWGDVGCPRGLVDYNTETNDVEHIELDSPRFIEADHKNMGTYDVENCYVRLISDEEWSLDRIEAWTEKTKCQSLEIKTSKKEKESSQAQSGLNPLNSFNELVEEYVSSGYVDLEGIDEQELIALGREIVEEADK